MRHGALRVIKSVAAFRDEKSTETSAFMLQVADDDGAFLVTAEQWVNDRWAGAAPILPSTRQHFQSVERMMLGEAEKRRHDGDYDLDRPMLLEQA